MTSEFKPDIFSNTIPSWNHAGEEITNIIMGILKFIPIEIKNFNNIDIEYPGSFEINSNNFRVTLGGDKFLLKRWSQKVEPQQLQIILEIMTWLTLNNLPVTAPVKFNNGDLLLFYDKYNWSLFPFVDGDYFSGKGYELESLAEISGILTEVLTKLPNELMPNSGPLHLSDSDDILIKEMDAQAKYWQLIFGDENACLLKNQWNEFRSVWDKLRTESIFPGPMMPSHFDLHPHNVLVKSGHVAALLDFESCKMFPIGYSFGFNTLKQCRQAVVSSGKKNNAQHIGYKYLNVMKRNCPRIESYIETISDLANTEVIRRLCVIFRLNIEQKNKIWNHILPIHLGHLKESKQIFK
jgi:hypothetical protein